MTLDHKFLNKIEALGTPTLENLSRFVWERLAAYRQAHPRQHPPRQLQRELHLLRSARAWAKRRAHHQDDSESWTATCIGRGFMDASTIEDRKTRARAWFERLRDDICASFERLEDDAPQSLYPGEAGRFKRTPWQRTDHTGAAGGGGVMSMMSRPPVREGRRALLDRARRIRARVSRADPGRGRRPAVLGLRHLADRASAQSARARRAHEHALRRHHQSLVRRRRRSHAGARPPAHAGRSPTRSPSMPR